MDDEKLAALERAAGFLLSETDNNLEPIPEYVADAALIRTLIEQHRTNPQRYGDVAMATAYESGFEAGERAEREKVVIWLQTEAESAPENWMVNERKTLNYRAAAIASGAHEVKPSNDGAQLTGCAAGRDGECGHRLCPQLRDNEPRATGRHCPLDVKDDEEQQP